MKNKRTLSRREFLKLSGIIISVVALKACMPESSATTPPPATISSKTPTHTPVPTSTSEPAEPLFPEMILVEPGRFQMGCVDNYPDQQRVHRVNITKPYYIAKHEMTFEDYDCFCEDTRSAKPDDRGWGHGKQALIHVDWNDAIRYCNWLSEKTGLTPCYSGKGKLTLCDFSAHGYRLPTEAAPFRRGIN